MDKMEFMSNEIAILTNKAIKGLPQRVGERCKIVGKTLFINFDYDVEFDDGVVHPVNEDELVKLTSEDKAYMEYIFTGNKILYWYDEVTIMKVDYLNYKVEIKFDDESCLVVGFENLHPIEQPKQNDSLGENTLGYFEKLGLSIGKLVDQKQRAYGDSVTKCYEIMKVLLQNYKNEDNTYTIPESLLPQMLLEVRKIDKMNRRFSNPDGDLMGENPFQDDVGYSMLGVRMVENLKFNNK